MLVSTGCHCGCNYHWNVDDQRKSYIRLLKNTYGKLAGISIKLDRLLLVLYIPNRVHRCYKSHFSIWPAFDRVYRIDYLTHKGQPRGFFYKETEEMTAAKKLKKAIESVQPLTFEEAVEARNQLIQKNKTVSKELLQFSKSFSIEDVEKAVNKKK